MSEVPAKSNDNSFELLGFDIIVDQNMKPWLIEINSPPAVQIEGKVDHLVKPKMMRDLIQLVFDRNIYSSSLPKMANIDPQFGNKSFY